MNTISNSYHLISQVVVGGVLNDPNLELHINIMHVFGCILSSNDEVIHMCFNVIILLILVRFANPKVLI